MCACVCVHTPSHNMYTALFIIYSQLTVPLKKICVAL